MNHINFNLNDGDTNHILSGIGEDFIIFGLTSRLFR